MYKKNPTNDLTNGNYRMEHLECRQIAAILLKVPDSGELWLDDMIKESLRNEFAEKALTGLCTTSDPVDPDALADRAYVIADAMIAARGIR